MPLICQLVPQLNGTVPEALVVGGVPKKNELEALPLEMQVNLPHLKLSRVVDGTET